jgi:predicted nuclease with TOPRIM domain
MRGIGVVRPKILDDPITKTFNLEREHWNHIVETGLKPSEFFRDMIKDSMEKMDLYKEVQELREQLVKSKNENLELLKEIDSMNKSKVQEALEQAEAEKMRLMPKDEKILENPKEFLKWLDMYDNFIISEQSFIAKVGMTPSRAKRLVEEYM